MKILIGFVGILVALCACMPTENAVVDQGGLDANEVQSFPLDSKQYRYVELDNGIRVLLVSDDNAVKSLASLNVHIGSFEDPEEWQGLAHFLEHMLFLGTEKYPDSAEYSEYLEKNGGSRNAYTDYEITNYHFSVDNSAYEGALDRFSQFFIAPLFTQEYVDREKNAVHSEYYTRINNDQIRDVEVFENVINPAHPAFKFNAGNLDTLSDKPERTARDELIDFYNTYYSSHLMTLALVSNHSLDELEKLAREKFSAVPKLNNVPETAFPALFAEGELPKVLEIKPVQDAHSMVLSFPIAEQTDFAMENPTGFVAAMLNAKGENSLSERLKAKGWIQNYQALNGQSYGTEDTFIIWVALTEKGVEHQDEIIAAMFDQIALVKKEGVKEWRYNELSNLSEMGFRFSENSSLSLQGAIDFANALQDTLPRDLITAGYKRFDSDQINAVLNSLTVDNMVVMLSSPTVEPELETEFYGADYRTYKPSAERVKNWGVSQFPNLALPARNPLIPENFDLVDVKTAEQPAKLADTGGMDVWHYPNIEDGVPKATVQLAIDRPQRTTVEESLVAEVYFALLGFQLESLKFDANRAGVSYNVGANGVSFSGYSDKLPQLVDQVLAQVLKPTFTEGQLGRVTENIKRYFANYDKAEPAQGVNRDLDNLLNADSYSVEELRAVADALTLEQVLAAPQWLFGEGRMTMLASGNITEQQSRKFAEQIKNTLGLKSTDKAIPKGQRVVKLNTTDKPDVFVAKLSHGDAAVVRYYQGRESTRRERITLYLLGQVIGQQYFNSLRTEQQLGYIVGARSKNTDRTPGMTFLVQSPTATATQVEAATDKFLLEFQQSINGMTDEDLMPIKQAALAQVQQPPQNVAEKVGRFWKDLRDDYPNFDSRQQTIDILKTITMKDVQDAYNEILIEAPRAVSVISPGAKGGVTASVDSTEAFREGKELIIRK